MSSAEASYSPRQKIGVLFCGTGTAGAYHAGAWKALAESGVRVDLLAGQGAGVVTALAGAVDGGAPLWQTDGPWSAPELGRAYRWRRGLRIAAAGLIAGAAALLSPFLVLVLAALLYAASLLAALISLPEASAALIETYRWSIDRLFLPPWIPTIVPRALVLALLAVLAVLVASAVRTAVEERSRRRLRGGFWWRLVAWPLDATEPGATLERTLWRLVRGAADGQAPPAGELGRRYAEILTENFGQPGFREVLIGVHDLDARRDLVGGLLSGRVRVVPTVPAWGPREAEFVDLGGAERGLIADFLQGALRLPVVAPPHGVTFAADSYWRGEHHRLCDRPELAVRLVEEMALAGVEHVIVLSAAPPPAAPHELRSRPLDFRARVGEYLRSMESAVVRDAVATAAARGLGVSVIRPDHNPFGPFDFGATYDEASDRTSRLSELVAQGHQDAYRQFIEPAVASGGRVEIG